MSTTIPSRDIPAPKRAEYRASVLAKATQVAISIGVVNAQHELSKLDLAPEYLGLNTWATGPLNQGYNEWVNYRIKNATIVCIYKVLQLSNNPTVTRLRFAYRSMVLGVHELEACYSGLPIIRNLTKALLSPEAKEVLDRLAGRETVLSPDIGSPMEAYFDEPYIFGPNDGLIIDAFTRADSLGDYLVLGGYVLERAGTTIV